jgi:hypothetical protein
VERACRKNFTPTLRISSDTQRANKFLIGRFLIEEFNPQAFVSLLETLRRITIYPEFQSCTKGPSVAGAGAVRIKFDVQTWESLPVPADCTLRCTVHVETLHAFADLQVVSSIVMLSSDLSPTGKG